MAWSPDQTLLDNLFHFNEQCWEAGYLDVLYEGDVSYSQHSHSASNPSMLQPTHVQAEGSSNDTYIPQHSIASSIETNHHSMSYITPMLGQPTSPSPQPAHTMQSPPDLIPDSHIQVRKRSRARPRPYKAETSMGPFKCEWNGCRSTQSFGRLNVLWRHIATQHLFPGAYKCHREGCSKSFNRKDNLEEHALRVHGERRF